MPATFDAVALVVLRQRRGLSQQKLADALGVSRQAVSDWERGCKHPEINKLPLLAEVLRCNMEDLFSVRLAA
jgi:transcriptional regulator with XRE-family HTH domain